MVPISCTIKKYINVLFSSSVNDGRQEKNFVLIYVVVINALYRKDSFVTHRAFCDALTGELQDEPEHFQHRRNVTEPCTRAVHFINAQL